MQEEIMNVTNNSLEGNETITVIPEVPNGKSVGKGKAIKIGIAGLVIGVGAAIGAIVKKNKGKLCKHYAKKLEKKGYLVVSPEEQEMVEPLSEELDK